LALPATMAPGCWPEARRRPRPPLRPDPGACGASRCPANRLRRPLPAQLLV
jgi:hypothetical protein